MAEEQEKTFTVKDKRKFSVDGTPKPEREAPPPEPEGEHKGAKPQQEKQPAGEIPLPEITFSSFIFSLSSSALLHFGLVADPLTQKRERNLPLAKQTIDILGILRDKTKGNLTHEEEQLIDTILYDLRIRYVEESKKG